MTLAASQKKTSPDSTMLQYSGSKCGLQAARGPSSLYKGPLIPANTQRHRNVVTTSMQRHDVATMLLRRCMFAGMGAM